MIPEYKKPPIRPAEIIIGLVHIVLGLVLLLLQWDVPRTISILAIAVGVSTIFRWRPGIILGNSMGIVIFPLALFGMISSLGFQTEIGQLYPGPLIFIVALIGAGWAILLLYPFWRKT